MSIQTNMFLQQWQAENALEKSMQNQLSLVSLSIGSPMTSWDGAFIRIIKLSNWWYIFCEFVCFFLN